MKRNAIMASLTLLVMVLPAHATHSDDQALEQEIRSRSSSASSQPKAPPSLDTTLKALRALEEGVSQTPSACEETERRPFGGKYVLSLDPQGQPCRIYDLSYPTLKSLFQVQGKNAVSRIPVERFKSRDYVNWLRGNYEEVYRRFSEIQATTTLESAARANWLSELRFKRRSDQTGTIPQGRAGSSLPRSFYASDLEVGKFQWRAADRKAIQSLISQVQALSTEANIDSSEFEQAWGETLAEPETFLQKIKFEWNDIEKVYEVFLEGQFIPLNGPVVLIDFKRPYKQAVESLLRSVVGSSLYGLSRMIPNTAVRNLVSVAINDSFLFLETGAQIQMAQLEQTLRMGLKNQIQIETDPSNLQKSLNLVFTSGSSLMTDYIMSLAKGKKFEWEKLEESSRLSRYRAEKSRNITLANLHSRLALQKGCELERIGEFFATCSFDGEKKSVYSLMTDLKILFWNPGAPVIHSYSRPSSVFVKRSATWLLSAGVRMFDIPLLSRRLTFKLGYLLQDISKAGMVDEVYLRQDLWLQKRLAPPLREEQEVMLTWLYRQHINPFLPFSETSEESIINANAAQLGLQTGGGLQ